MSLHYKYFLFALLGALLTAISVKLYPKTFPLAIVDMQRLLNQPAVLLSQSKLTGNEQKKILKRYAFLLPKVLLVYGKSHQLTLITATVISSGYLDVTDKIIEITLKKIKSHA